MNFSERAFLARGIDAQKAKNLVQAGLTLARLKSKTTDELISLGLNPLAAEAVRGEGRPPIPAETLTRVLFANRFTCCVCREPNKPIILHHIRPWEESHSHDESNLAVLCLDDHGHAHSRKELSRNLDARALSNAKSTWESEVKRLDSEAVIRATSVEYSAWGYFNHLRLFELAEEHKIDLSKVSGFSNLRTLDLVFPDGMLRPRPRNTFYMYEGAEILHLHRYTKGVMNAVLRRLVVFNISDYLDRGDLPHLLATGDFIFVQGAHAFKRLITRYRGPEQTTRGVRQANRVNVSFTFDRWEALSSSAHADWLSGTKRAGTLLQVRSVERAGGKLLIRGTAIGISNGYGDLQYRDYAPAFGRFVEFDGDDEFGDTIAEATQAWSES